MLESFRPRLRGKVIEIGAGTGNISCMYADWVEELLLLEPAKNLYLHLQERFAGRPHVRTVCELVEDVHAREMASPGSCGGPFDAALLANVLEHISDDAAMLRQIFDLVRPGGSLLLFVPALPWLYGALDTRVHHLRRYKRDSLADVVGRAGFTMQSMHFFDLPGVIPWFVAGRVLRQKEYSEPMAKLYDRMVVPVARLLEKVVKPPFGKNLICIAERPANPKA